MSAILRSLSPVVLLLIVLVRGSFADEPRSRTEVAKLGKIASALVEAKPNYGSAFCIHPSGLFLTNAHVVENVSDTGTATLVMNTGMPDQTTLKAKVVRRDKELDLAVLQTSYTGELPALELRTEKGPEELEELVALGFPFGRALARQGEYPAITTNIVNVSSLRRDVTGEIVRIQVDSNLNPGNSGGPMLDRSGKVAGMVVSGIPGAGINMAIPAAHLQQFLAKPLITFTTPEIQSDKQYEPVLFRANVVRLPPSDDPIEVELVLASPDGALRRFSMKAIGGVYQVQAPAFQRATTAKKVQLEVSYADGLVRGSATDREVAIGERRVQLSALKNLKLGSSGAGVLRDTSKVEGPIQNFEAIAVEVGGQSLSLNLRDAIALEVLSDTDEGAVTCRVIAKSAGKEIGRLEEVLYKDGHHLTTLDAIRDGKFHKPGRTTSPVTYLEVESMAGDFIGEGKKYSYKNDRITAAGSHTHVQVKVDAWQIEFGGPKRGKLAIGEVVEAKRWPFNDNLHGISFSGNGRGCNEIVGKFVIWELEFEENRISRLAVDFLQQCEHSGAAPLCGMLRINATYR